MRDLNSTVADNLRAVLGRVIILAARADLIGSGDIGVFCALARMDSARFIGPRGTNVARSLDGTACLIQAADDPPDLWGVWMQWDSFIACWEDARRLIAEMGGEDLAEMMDAGIPDAGGSTCGVAVADAATYPNATYVAVTTPPMAT